MILWKGRILLIVLVLERWLAGLLGMKRCYERHLRRLVERTGLFDAAYYLATNPEIAGQGKSPLNHYVAYGDRQGLQPLPCFDPRYVRARNTGIFRQINTLLYYVYVGRHLRLSPGPWFDIDYYLRKNQDVARSGIDPLLHYLKRGGAEGRSPCPQFDGAYYLRANPDVAVARVNPLLHYLRVGRFEGRPIAPHQAMPPVEDVQTMPALNHWPALLRRHDPDNAKVDVVVPVYKDCELTLRCLYSVLGSSPETPFELIVIDDQSPDTDLAAALEKLAGAGLITLFQNQSNCGFVHTANRGMQLHSDRDVILLNSDTEVFGNWLDRLRAAAHRRSRTGTVTPFSNNATICSYPCFLYDNPFPLELPYEQLDMLAAGVNREIEVEAPTGVGFCMYIRRDCIADVGLFDEKTFGRGYGEENDFCQRAIQKGWRNVLIADTFVRHWGSASFQAEKAVQITAALQALDILHPEYRPAVRRFIRQDPLAEARRRMDWARLLRHVKAQNILVIFDHNSEGHNQHAQEYMWHMLKRDIGVFYLHPVVGEPSHAILGHPKCSQLMNIKPLELADIDAIVAALADLRLSGIYAQGLENFTVEAREYMATIAQHLDVALKNVNCLIPSPTATG